MKKKMSPQRNKPVSINDLPPADVKRWVPARKAIVVEAVEGGVISLEEACLRYTLSIEEFTSWQRAKDQFGLRGLKAQNLRARNSAKKAKN